MSDSKSDKNPTTDKSPDKVADVNQEALQALEIINQDARLAPLPEDRHVVRQRAYSYLRQALTPDPQEEE